MRVAFDTSVLVAGSVLGHAHEPRARVWLDAARSGRLRGVVATHGLAELWATLTALPVEPRLPAERVTALVESLSSYVEIVALAPADYAAAMRRCSERGLRSGAVFDALHVVAAERAGVDLVLTFDARRFVALARPEGPRVLAPPDPPGLLGS